jgi:hypothetical protein
VLISSERRVLLAGCWLVLREKYCWLVADKPSEQCDESYDKVATRGNGDGGVCRGGGRGGLRGAWHPPTSCQST